MLKPRSRRPPEIQVALLNEPRQTQDHETAPKHRVLAPAMDGLPADVADEQFQVVTVSPLDAPPLDVECSELFPQGV